MSSLQLKAQKREKFGSLEAKRIKNAGNIPAVILSKKGNADIIINSKEFELEFKKGNIQSKVIEIEVDGKKIKSIARTIDLDPVSDRVVHVDFLNLDEAKKVRAWPKVEIKNTEKSPGIKKGGFLNIRLHKVEVVCDDISKIPGSVVIDASRLAVGDKVRRDDVTLEAGVKFASSNNFLFASITGRGKSEDEAATGDAAAAAAGPAGAAVAAEEAAKKEAAKKDEAKK